MKISYSRVEKYKQCPYAYMLRYLEGIEVPFNCDPKNALIQGTAVHTGLEKGAQEALNQYANAYPVLTDDIITEQIMLEAQIEKARKICPRGEFEVKIENDQYKGFIDLLVKNDDATYSIYDFKFSNNEQNYSKSSQLHVYKQMFEYIYKLPVSNLYYLMIPKVNLKRKYDESTESYRSRLIQEEKDENLYTPYFVQIKYDQNKATEWTLAAFEMLSAKKFEKKESRLCNWCEYQQFCEKGIDYMLLPKNERREKKVILDPNIWIYGDSYVGKSTFVDQFDDFIMVNTDGNTENITSPIVPIANEVIIEGRLRKETLAWEKFKEFVEELEKKDNTFKGVALDLFEDLYEHCRVYMYKKLGIEHEQDAGFGKGWDMVKTEFFSTIKRLNHLGYQVVFISKELATEVKLKYGSGYTTFKPNIQDKVAQVITGIVGMTIRAYVDDGMHKLQLQKKENVFGGGRFEFKNSTCALTRDEFLVELTLAQDDSVKVESARKSRTPKKKEEINELKEEVTEEELAGKVLTDDLQEEIAEQRVAKVRERRKREVVVETTEEAAAEVTQAPRERKRRDRKIVEDAPVEQIIASEEVTRTRRRREQ